MMLFIHRQYSRSTRQLAIRPDLVVAPPHREERAVVPVPGINRAVIQAVNVARSISPDVIAVYIAQDPDAAAEMRERWERQVPGVPLVVVESPYRALAGPLLAYLDVLDRAWPPDKPAADHLRRDPGVRGAPWWERILYNQSVRRGCGPRCSGGRTRSWSTCRIAARTRSVRGRRAGARRDRPATRRRRGDRGAGPRRT